MNVLANVYAYSKNTSTTMFKCRKADIVKEETKETSWLKLCYAKYEDTKNTCYVYINYINNKIKRNSANVFVYLSFLNFNENCKYVNSPWYRRLYLKLKYQIKVLIKIKNSKIPAKVDVPVTRSEVLESEMKRPIEKLSDESVVPIQFAADDSNIRNSYSSQGSTGKLSFRCNRQFKRTNSEGVNEKESSFSSERTYSKRSGLSYQNRTESLLRSFIPFRNSSSIVGTNENFCDVKQTIELIDVNKEKKTLIVAENASETVITEQYIKEELLTPSEKNSNVIEKDGLTDNIQKKLNFKSAWAKFSSLIA